MRRARLMRQALRGRRRSSAAWSGTAVCVLIAGVAACGSDSLTPVASNGGPTTGSSVARTVPSLLSAKGTCPLAAATVSSIVGVRVYAQSGSPPGSCAFDSVRRGRGLTAPEVRVNIQVGPNDLRSLYGFFSQQVTKGLPSCQPFRLLRRADLGPGGFETLCGATAKAGQPSSADDYFPLRDGKQLTVTVNRGVAVTDHRLVTCWTQTAALVKEIRTSW